MTTAMWLNTTHSVPLGLSSLVHEFKGLDTTTLNSSSRFNGRYSKKKKKKLTQLSSILVICEKEIDF